MHQTKFLSVKDKIERYAKNNKRNVVQIVLKQPRLFLPLQFFFIFATEVDSLTAPLALCHVAHYRYAKGTSRRQLLLSCSNHHVASAFAIMMQLAHAHASACTCSPTTSSICIDSAIRLCQALPAGSAVQEG